MAPRQRRVNRQTQQARPSNVSPFPAVQNVTPNGTVPAATAPVDIVPVQSAPEAPQATELSRPVLLDMSKFEIDDMDTMLRISALGERSNTDPEVIAMVPQVIAMLRRIVIGGLSGRPSTEFWAVLGAVMQQIGQHGNPKN